MRRWAAAGGLVALQLGAVPAFAHTAAGEAPETPPPVQPITATGEVMVHIDTNLEAAGLEPAELGAARCPAPCDKPFPGDGLYRIAGEGLVPSETFHLRGRFKAVTLDVDAGLRSQKTAGAVMGIGGILVSSLGIVYSFYVVADDIDGPPATATQRGIMLGTILGGLASTAIGALLYFTAGTRVRLKGTALRGAP